MFHPVTCPVCRKLLCEREEGSGPAVRVVCRCGRKLEIGASGTVNVIEDHRAAARLAVASRRGVPTPV